jgi:galactokinase/mevalonate kinase-like predicted kinase
MTIFDRLVPAYLGLPGTAPGRGQVVVTTGDVLLTFDAAAVKFADEGITGLGCYAAPELAANHGVFCPDGDGRVRLFLQKPSPAEQSRRGAIQRHGRSVLDIGVMSLDARAAVALITIFKVKRNAVGGLEWESDMAAAVERVGLDFYREICCGMGTEAEFSDFTDTVKRAGSGLGPRHLRRVFDKVSTIPFHLSLLPACGFLHFGTPRQLIRSGSDLLSMDLGTSHEGSLLSINNEVSGGGRIAGEDSWVEGCRVHSELILGGGNVVIGADVRTRLALPKNAVLDVLEGADSRGRRAWFVRCYGTDDILNKPAAEGGVLAGLPIRKWLEAMDAGEGDVWDEGCAPGERQAWSGRFFPAVRSLEKYRDWIWMLDPKDASPAQKKAWKRADRWSFAEMAVLASQPEFHLRRAENRAGELRGSLRRLFRPESGFSAAELSFVFRTIGPQRRTEWLLGVLDDIFIHFGGERYLPGTEQLELSRTLHTLGSAVARRVGEGDRGWKEMLGTVRARLSAAQRTWLAGLGIGEDAFKNPGAWVEAARNAAFENVGRTIVLSSRRNADHPKNALRSDEIIWGRAPARLDLGGGWSDTPPYSLEHGGSVINAAVNLNGQPPIHAYARVIHEPEIRIGSIDHGARVVIRELRDLLDYRQPSSRFALAKAALAMSGFSPDSAAWPRKAGTLREMLKLFGGGVELTTLAAIPSGSGLGTSSIMGAVLMAVIHRMLGRRLSPQELFHGVLRLEQELTTGGGWQDQIGGAVGGVKMITAEPGLIPDPRIHFVPPDVLDPIANGGQTLLYYTGIRRLAKNILRFVVGNYLDRDRAAMNTLRQLHAFPPAMANAMSAKDIRAFGELIDLAWNLNKAIDPDSTTDLIEGILARIEPQIHGAKLLGAGGGGFLLIVCKSKEDAATVRKALESEPPNDRARFFDFATSSEGLIVTVC